MKATGARALVWLFLLAWEARAKRENNVRYRSLQAASEVEEGTGLAAEGEQAGGYWRWAWKDDPESLSRILRFSRFKLKDTSGCTWNEDWASWGECSATCGGGIRSRTLRSLVVTESQDSKACPTQCSGEACSEQEFERCNEEICDIDCSTIDFGNRVSSGGVAVKWDFQRLEGHCVFQFWQYVEAQLPKASKIVLLGEAEPLDGNGPKLGSWRNPVTIGSSQASSVVLGFRGCTLQGLPDAPPSNNSYPDGPFVKKFCLYEDSPFQEGKQTTSLSIKQREALYRYRMRTNYRGDRSAGELSRNFPKDDQWWQFWTGLTSQPSFSLSATMEPTVPAPPRIEQALEADDDLLIRGNLSAEDGGAVVTAYTAAVRKLTFGDTSVCEFTSLPECPSDASDKEPCTKVTASTNASHVSLILRNLQLAGNYEVTVKALNSVGSSLPSEPIKVSTRAAPGVPKSTCAVHSWYLAHEHKDAQAIPAKKDEVQCQLQSSPLPKCVMKPRTTRLFKKTKCDGKKYWRRFEPIMSAGYKDCLQTSFNLMTVCEHDLAFFGRSEEAKKCEAQGCSTSTLSSLTKKEKHCCCKTENDSEADSPSCACSQASCSELGLFEAKDPMLSCRH